MQNLFHFSSISLYRKLSFSLPKHFLFSLNLKLTWISALSDLFFIGMISFSLFLHAFHTFRPRFLVFGIFLGFLKIDEYFVNFWVGFCLNDVICSYVAFHLHLCQVLQMCISMLEPCVLVGLDQAEPMMKFLLHVTCSCTIHAYVPFHLFLILPVDWCFSVSLSLSLSLSLSRIVCAWPLSAKLLHLKTLFVLGHLLLIPHLSMLGSMMRRLVRTFWRTSPNVAFIQNATLSYRTSSILLFRLSYTSRVGNLFVRYP